MIFKTKRRGRTAGRFRRVRDEEPGHGLLGEPDVDHGVLAKGCNAAVQLPSAGTCMFSVHGEIHQPRANPSVDGSLIGFREDLFDSDLFKRFIRYRHNSG